MAMRVNTNIAALNALRQLGRTEKNMRTNLERLSSGRRLNKAADGPASMVISEQMKSQISSIGQAINNSETSISMLQTIEGALSESSNILVNMRQLTIHAANEGTNDIKMLQADQNEIDNLISTLKRISETTQFGTRFLLNGSNTTNGVAVGDGLEYVAATTETKSSPSEGYKIDITRVATRSMTFGMRALQLDDVREEAGFSIVLSEGGRNASLNINSEQQLRKQIDKFIDSTEREIDPLDPEEALQTIQQLITNKLQKKIDDAGLQLDTFIYKSPDLFGEQVSDWDQMEERLVQLANYPPELKELSEQKLMVIRHKEYGSEPTFSVTISIADYFEEESPSNVAIIAIPGRDVEGTIGGHPELEAGELALGKGQSLTAGPGTEAEGLTINYTNNTDDIIYQVLKRYGVESEGILVLNQNDEVLIGDEKPNSGFFGEEIPEIDGYVHLTQGAVNFQIGPNQGQQAKISISDTRPASLANKVKNDSGFQSLEDIIVLTADQAMDSMGLIDSAIEEVSFLRAKIGAFQRNALESNLNSLRIAKESLTASESQLADSDMAAEMADFTKNQILLSTGTAMLAQANQMPKTVLQLLSNNQ